jgi:pimeloyl-ACP methyl ester carboxylesterase
MPTDPAAFAVHRRSAGLPVLPQIEAAAARNLGQERPFFIPPGAKAYPRDNPNATVQFLNTGHSALETHVEEIAAAMRQFLAKTTAWTTIRI